MFKILFRSTSYYNGLHLSFTKIFMYSFNLFSKSITYTDLSKASGDRNSVTLQHVPIARSLLGVGTVQVDSRSGWMERVAERNRDMDRL